MNLIIRIALAMIAKTTSVITQAFSPSYMMAIPTEIRTKSKRDIATMDSLIEGDLKRKTIMAPSVLTKAMPL